MISSRRHISVPPFYRKPECKTRAFSNSHGDKFSPHSQSRTEGLSRTAEPEGLSVSPSVEPADLTRVESRSQADDRNERERRSGR